MGYLVGFLIFGLLVEAVLISMSLLVVGQPADDDMEAYQKETGRSAQDIAQGNAALQARQDSDVQPQKASGSNGPPSHALAGSPVTSQRYDPE